MPARRERRRPRSDLPPRPPRCALRARRVATTTPAVSRPEVGEAATSSVTAVSTAMMLGGLCEGRVRHTRRHPAALTSTECRSRPPLRRRGPPRRLHLRSRMEHRLAATIWGYKILTAAWCLSEEVHDHQVEYLCTRLHRMKSTKAISGGKILQREVLAHNNIAGFSEQTDHPIYSEDKRTTLQERSEILEAPQRAATDKSQILDALQPTAIDKIMDNKISGFHLTRRLGPSLLQDWQLIRLPQKEDQTSKTKHR